MTDAPSSAAVELPDFKQLDTHLWCVDTRQVREMLACCYLIGDGTHYAFIECGTNEGVPRLLALLDHLGIARAQISHVIPTHIHLDHAGGAGQLMQALPEAELVIHSRGARHMVDPTALAKGVAEVYGEAEAHAMYGDLVPVDEARVRVADTGAIVDVGTRRLEIMDSPGHARHHFSIWDAQTKGWFTGDTFGLSYREFDSELGPMVLPTTTPVHFDPDAWRATLDNFQARDPDCVYLTHYSRVRDISRLADDLRRGLADYEAIARSLKDAANRHAALVDALMAHAVGSAQRHGVAMDEARMRELLAHDIELNAQGIGVWLDRDAA